MKLVEGWIGVYDGWDSRLNFTVPIADDEVEIWEKMSDSEKLGYVARCIAPKIYWGVKDDERKIDAIV